MTRPARRLGLFVRANSGNTGTTPCRDSHAVTESCEIEPFYRGIRKVILLALALAGVE